MTPVPEFPSALAEQGSHDDLIAADGIYADLC